MNASPGPQFTRNDHSYTIVGVQRQIDFR